MQKIYRSHKIAYSWWSKTLRISVTLGCDNYRKLNQNLSKTTEVYQKVPKTKLPKINPNPELPALYVIELGLRWVSVV